MPTAKRNKPAIARIPKFAGLSNRAIPVKLSRVESPDLLNVELSGRILEKRNGFRRLHTNRLRKASIRVDGLKDYFRIPNLAAYRGGGINGFYIAIGVVLRAAPTVAVPIKAMASMGFGIAGSLAWEVYYDQSLNAGAGGWGATVYDTGGAVHRAAVVNDSAAVGEFRMLEAFVNGGGNLELKVWKEDGTVTSGTSAAFTGASLSSTEPILIGAHQSASGVIDATMSFPHASICELRYFVGTIPNIANRQITTTNLWYKREIEDGNVSLFTGYWKCNDGNTDGKLLDSTSTANYASAPEEPVAWIHDPAKVTGTSGLNFFANTAATAAYSPWIHIKETGSATILQNVFVPPTGTFGNFTLRLIYSPAAPTTGAAVPNGVLCWAGHNTGTPTRPQPVCIFISGDQLNASFDDNGTTRTCTIATLVSTLVGKKLRVALHRSGSGGGTNQLLLVAAYVNPTTGLLTQMVSPAVACTGTVAGAVSTNWAVARHMTAFAQTAGTAGVGGQFGTPYTDGAAFGVIDNVQLIHCNSPANAFNVGLGSHASLGPSIIYEEIVNWQQWFPFCTTIFNLNLNEGSGNILAIDTNSAGQFAATLHPQIGRSVKWDLGLVDPYRDPPGQTLAEYHRRRADGTELRETLIISGSTLYKLDDANTLAIPIAAGIFQGGQWSHARYGNDLLFASPNGKRPIRWNGSNLDLLGIEAPLNSIQVVTSNTGPGAFVTGSTYSFYCTFRNKSTGDESNPSPVETVTFGGGTDTIDSLRVPISSDQQVNQRRIWQVPPPGTPGSQAYLLHTIDDNVTTEWTTDITTPVATGTVMEYFTNQEAPQASVIEVHKDFAFVGGNQVYPTRFFRSVAGRMSRWDHDIFYVDLDLDSGDPIVAAKKQVNNLFVSLRDGWARVFPTGDTNNPVAFSFTRRDHGATGPSAVAVADDLIYYLSERDMYASDGFQEQNISSPPSEEYPSIETTMTIGLNDARREFASMAYNRSRKQVWIACSSADADENDMILVYDIVRQVWSKYDIPAATLQEIDDANDQSRVYGIVQGYVCRLDEPSWGDGVQAPLVAVCASGTTTTFTAAGTPFTGLDLRGLTAFIYQSVLRVGHTAVIYSNTNSVLTFYDTLSFTPAAGDGVVIGAYRWFADFVVDFGDPLCKKRLKWLKLLGTSDSDNNKLVVSIREDMIDRANVTQDGAWPIVQNWKADEPFKAFAIGGHGRSFRIRFQDTTIQDVRAEHCPPNIYGKLRIAEIQIEAEELGHVV